MNWIRLALIDAPTFVISTWLRLYALVLAAICFIVWGSLLIWLARVAWDRLLSP
jgi:hypothetical protein